MTISSAGSTVMLLRPRRLLAGVLTLAFAGWLPAQEGSTETAEQAPSASSRQAPDLQLETPVFLRGHRVTPDHVVFGTVDRVRGREATINLGYAHGMRAGTRLLFVHSFGETVVPIGGGIVRRNQPEESEVSMEGPFRPQKGDLVLVRARQLELWEPHPRADRLVRERLSRRRMQHGYDTLDLPSRLIEEVGRDDEYQYEQFTGADLNQFITVAERRSGILQSRIGAVTALPLITDETEESETLREQRAQMDLTMLTLSQFLETARTPEKLVPFLSEDRMQRLTPLDPRLVITEDSAPLIRDVLLVWTRKVITDTESIRPVAQTEDEESPDGDESSTTF